MTSDLLPCPFCGSEAALERDSDHHGEWFNLGCSRHWGAVKDERERCPGGRIWYTESPDELPAAITAWNTRAAGSHLPSFIGTGEPQPCFACNDSGQERWVGYGGTEEVGPCSVCQQEATDDQT